MEWGLGEGETAISPTWNEVPLLQRLNKLGQIRVARGQFENHLRKRKQTKGINNRKRKKIEGFSF
jgi:hypothetical protein